MKPHAWLTLMLTLALGCTSTAQESRQGTLKSVTGDVVLQQNGVTRAAVVGNGVLQADRILTGSNAGASLTLRDGTFIVIGPHSDVDLFKAEFDPTGKDGSLSIHLLKGTLRVVTGWLAKLYPDHVRVSTPTAVMGLRGTDFIVEVP